DGGAPMSPEIARKVIELFREVRPPAPQAHTLTPQEVRLLGLLSAGHSYQNAAGQLGITINTVRNYVRSIYDKLHVHTKSEAVAKALKQGILR
ncbi:MAG TPA: LuxR C-terminal-related transcriptional regulator, partial [Kofleriaceae bacterium]|nr:LuxR C-terminal-related transcriptional regulator [Kofleriaceae bacterium]